MLWTLPAGAHCPTEIQPDWCSQIKPSDCYTVPDICCDVCSRHVYDPYSTSTSCPLRCRMIITNKVTSYHRRPLSSGRRELITGYPIILRPVSRNQTEIILMNIGGNSHWTVTHLSPSIEKGTNVLSSSTYRHYIVESEGDIGQLIINA